MKIKQYLLCVAEAAHYQDRDAYVSDLALSSVWDDADAIPAERIDSIGQIWDACHRTVKDIAADAGLSLRKLAERFCIPYRTMEDWGADKRTPPVYVLLMMQECLGLLSL